ncbi:hypothetical protein DVK85_07065 [Flavobacterium arcticum]|uniref:Lipoprotein n=1 Tax=Flavobacterium arcticum TaxID=1784713 RepID=A0A345HBQ6_9FLAO|nr:hypothetical protein [Flavobacterium arcticum]AXG74016.1 hypothetical protein DVK85_07065 [Flavobacterium arcticum]KAF2508994.1 hypothetical protein E0W72_10550 [Flavobacterium arcticum]
MKKLLLLLLGISLLSLYSCSDKKEKTVILDEKATSKQEDSLCMTQYMECIKPLQNAYSQVVEKAANKRKADSISKDEYDAACEEAYSIMQKEIEYCDKVFEKCLIE